MHGADGACFQTRGLSGKKRRQDRGDARGSLVIEEEKMNRVKEICGAEPVFQIFPFRKMKAGIIATGSEVYRGRIKDRFTPVVKEKLEEFGVEVLGMLCATTMQR